MVLLAAAAKHARNASILDGVAPHRCASALGAAMPIAARACRWKTIRWRNDAVPATAHVGTKTPANVLAGVF